MKRSSSNKSKIRALISAFLLAAILAVRTGYCADETNSTTGKSEVLNGNEQQMWTLQKEVDKAQARTMSGFRGNDEQLWEDYQRINKIDVPKIFALARREPKSETAFEQGANGPIPTAWNITGWPAIFILDANGVIRFKARGYGPDTETLLDEKVEQVLNR